MDSVVPQQQVDVLIFAAHGPDLRRFRQHLGERIDGSVRGLWVAGKTVGLGSSAAAASAAKRVFQLSPRAAVLVGTCGIYAPTTNLQPRSVVVANDFRLVDHGVVAGRCVFPDPMQGRLDAHAVLSAGLAACGASVPRASVGSPLSRTMDDGLAAAVPPATGAHVENLEAFAVAYACHLAEVPVAAVLCASHVAGDGAARQWSENERECGIAAADLVLTWLHNGAQGLPHG